MFKYVILVIKDEF